jgi:predicted alpha/beta-fold hydrolase
MMAKDDPIIGHETICYEVSQKNPYLVLGLTERGGHLGYFESAFTTK